MEQYLKLKKYIINSSNKIKINSKEIKKNDIFIALKGSKNHGNRFINEAFKSGAKYCITDKKSNKFDNLEKILFVENIYDCLKELSIKKKINLSRRSYWYYRKCRQNFIKRKFKIFFRKKI